MRVLRHYGVDGPGAHALSWRRRSSASSWPSSARRPRSRSPPPSCGCWIEETPPRVSRCRVARAPAGTAGRATQLRYPVVGDLARSVRFRWFDQPRWTRSAPTSSPGSVTSSSALAANPATSPTAPRRIEALAAIPEQIVRLPGRAARARRFRIREPMLEVLARRHYREYELHDLRPSSRARRPFVVAELHARRPADPAGLGGRHGGGAGRPGRRAGPSATGSRRRPRRGRGSGGRPLPPLAGRARVAADETSRPSSRRCWRQLPRRPRRTPDLRWRSASGCGPPGRLLRLPSRPADGGVVEDDLIRGVHPMVGRRLEPVAAARLPRHPAATAPEDVLLYECVARENPADRRLVALAQVREIVRRPRRDRHGHGAAARRARGGELPGGDPPRPRRAAGRRSEARHEPRLGPRLAGRRRRRRRS